MNLGQRHKWAKKKPKVRIVGKTDAELREEAERIFWEKAKANLRRGIKDALAQAEAATDELTEICYLELAWGAQEALSEMEEKEMLSK